MKATSFGGAMSSAAKIYGEYEMISFGSAGQLYVQMFTINPPNILYELQEASPAFRKGNPSMPLRRENIGPAEVFRVKCLMAAWNKIHP